jgi:O-antigen/teichoic acid export membrane protein
VLKFGGPLVPASLAMYVLNTSDRWFVNHFNGQEALGHYAVGAKFAMLLYMAVITFRQAWWPVAMDSMHSEDGPALCRTIARLYLGLGSAGVVFLTALSPLLVRWFTASSFHAAYPIVGVLAWHSIFSGFYLIAAAGIWKKEKTSWVPILTGAAALLNIALNACLVPVYGGMGAALATSLSFLVWIVLTIVISERLWPVGYAFGILGLQVSIGAAACFVILQLYDKGSSFWAVAPVAAASIIILTALSATREHLGMVMNRIEKKLGKKHWERLKLYNKT